MQDQIKAASPGMVKALYLLIGVAIGGVLSGAFAFWQADPIFKDAAAQLAEYRSQARQSTIVFGPGAPSKPKTILQMLSILEGGNFSGIARLEMPRDTELRMMIPGKVTPTFYGDSTGIEYYHFDPVSGELSGPHKPGEKSDKNNQWTTKQ